MPDPRLYLEANQDRLLLEIYDLSRYIAAFMVRRQDLDDVVQDIAADCLVKLRAGEMNEVPTDMPAFVFTLVRNHIVNRFRKRVSTAECDAVHVPDKASTAPEWVSPDRSRDEAVLDALRKRLVAKLPKRCRQAYRMVRQGKSYAAVGRKLKVSIKTVQCYVVQAHLQLRKELNDLGFVPAATAKGGRARKTRRRWNRTRLSPKYAPHAAVPAAAAFDMTSDSSELIIALRRLAHARFDAATF